MLSHNLVRCYTRWLLVKNAMVFNNKNRAILKNLWMAKVIF